MCKNYVYRLVLVFKVFSRFCFKNRNMLFIVFIATQWFSRGTKRDYMIIYFRSYKLCCIFKRDEKFKEFESLDKSTMSGSKKY